MSFHIICARYSSCCWAFPCSVQYSLFWYLYSSQLGHEEWVPRSVASLQFGPVRSSGNFSPFAWAQDGFEEWVSDKQLPWIPWKRIEAVNPKMCLWKKMQRRCITEWQWAGGGRRLGSNAWLHNRLSDHPAVLVFPFLLLSPAGKAYAPEFYYDTYNPLWQNRPRVYSYSLQWTQMNPNAVDRILAYRLGIRQVRGEAPSCRSCLLVCWPLPGLPGLICSFLFVLFYFISLCVVCFPPSFLVLWIGVVSPPSRRFAVILQVWSCAVCRSWKLICTFPVWNRD